MTKTIHCQSCNTVQPKDWKQGDFCMECGQVVRTDVHCAWCTHKVPVAKFCRDCGFEMVAPDMFGVARILIDGNVDKLSLAKQIAEMDEGTITHYKNLYNQQYAVLMNRVDELRYFEKFTVYNDYSSNLYEDLIKEIPFDEALLEKLKSGSTAPFDGRPEKIIESIEKSPINPTRLLGLLAAVQINTPDWKDEYRQKVVDKLFESPYRYNFSGNSPEALKFQVEYFAALSAPEAIMHYKRKRNISYASLSPYLKHQASFVEQHWSSLEEKQKLRIIPFLYQSRKMEGLREHIEEFDHLIDLAYMSDKKTLRSSAAMVAQNDKWHWLSISESPYEKLGKYCTEISAYEGSFKNAVQLFKNGTAPLKAIFIDNFSLKKQKETSKELKAEFAKLLEAYIHGREVKNKARATHILSQISPKENAGVEAVKAIDDNSEVLALFDKTTDIPMCNELVEKLVSYPLDSKSTRAIKQKLIFFDLDISEEAISALFRHGKENDNNQVEAIITKIMSYGSKSSFYAAKVYFNGILFENAEDQYEDIFYNSVLSHLKFINPNSGTKENFKPNNEHADLFFGGTDKFVMGFLSKIVTSEFSEEYYRIFWKDKELHWKNWLKNNVDLRTQVLDGFTNFLKSEQTDIEKKTWILDFIEANNDILEKKDAENLVISMKGLPAVSTTKYKGAHYFLSKIQEVFKERFSLEFQINEI